MSGRLQPPQTETHTDKLFTKSAQQDRQQLTFHTGFLGENTKTFFVVMKTTYPKTSLKRYSKKYVEQ